MRLNMRQPEVKPNDLILRQLAQGKAELAASLFVVALLKENPSERVGDFPAVRLYAASRPSQFQRRAQVLVVVGQDIGQIVGSKHVVGFNIDGRSVSLLCLLGFALK